MMFSILDPVLRYFQTKNVRTTSFVFKLITRFTVNMFVVFTILIGAKNLFGHAIECFHEDGRLKATMELSCWLEGIYIDESLLTGKRGTEVVHYGVGSRSGDNQNVITFKFYQWIVPLLMAQTLLLYLPRLLWHTIEKGTMNRLLDGVRYPVFTDGWKDKRTQLVAYLKEVKKQTHRSFALKYLFCEFLTIAVILFNMFLTKHVITDFWSAYQPAVAAFFKGDFSKFNQAAARLFPIQAKCNFNKFGPSGNIEDRDLLCILPQNIVNEKIFVVLYIWYIFILICAILNVMYLLVMFIFKTLRIFNIGHMLERTVTIRECKEISCNGDIGLWFTLNIYRKNMVATYFQNLCNELLKNPKREKSFDKHNLDYEDIENY